MFCLKKSYECRIEKVVTLSIVKEDFFTRYKTYAEPFLIQDFKFSLETLSDKIKKNYTDRRDR